MRVVAERLLWDPPQPHRCALVTRFTVRRVPAQISRLPVTCSGPFRVDRARRAGLGDGDELLDGHGLGVKPRPLHVGEKDVGGAEDAIAGVDAALPFEPKQRVRRASPLDRRGRGNLRSWSGRSRRRFRLRTHERGMSGATDHPSSGSAVRPVRRSARHRRSRAVRRRAASAESRNSRAKIRK